MKVVTGGSEVEVSKDQENEIKDGDVIKFCEDKFHYSLGLLTDESDNETDQKMSAPSSPEKSRAEAILDQSKPLKSEGHSVKSKPQSEKDNANAHGSKLNEIKPNHKPEAEKEKRKVEPQEYEKKNKKPSKPAPVATGVESGSNKKPSKPAPVAIGVESGSNKKPSKPAQVGTVVESGSNKKPSKPTPVATGVKSGSDSARTPKTTPLKKNGGSTTSLGAKSPKDSDESDGYKSKDKSDGEDSKPSVLKFLVITPSDLENIDEEKPAKLKPKPNNSKFINITKILMTLKLILLLYFSNTF